MVISPFDVVLFDLDGTLVDTAPDLGFALNSLLQQEGLKPLDDSVIRPVASHGSAGLLKLGFAIEPSDERYANLQQQFIQLYADNITRRSRLFDGMSEVLKTLTEHDIRWGVVTNKPAFLTEPLMQQLQLTNQAACIVSGDTTAYSKPHPVPLQHACQLLKVSPADCIYIGDAQRDIEAARNADMRAIIAAYGYIEANENLTAWQADCLITQPLEILQWIQ